MFALRPSRKFPKFADKINLHALSAISAEPRWLNNLMGLFTRSLVSDVSAAEYTMNASRHKMIACYVKHKLAFASLLDGTSVEADSYDIEEDVWCCAHPIFVSFRRGNYTKKRYQAVAMLLQDLLHPNMSCRISAADALKSVGG